MLDGGAGASGDFDLILISCDGLHWHNGIPGLVSFEDAINLTLFTST